MNVLSLAYLGNVQWFGKVCFTDCVVDVGEHYLKQSFRNRCEILTAGGRTPLVVNTVREPNGRKASVRDTRVDWSKRWQHEHRQSLVSAYGSAPYFEHYWPELEPFFTRRYEFLTDLNLELADKMLHLLKSPARLNISEKYIEPCDDLADLRNSMSPKPRLHRADPQFRPQRYWQVFSDRMAFEPNLSVTDLLFCQGPCALELIRDSLIL